MFEGCVFNDGVWHTEQPIDLNSAAPCVIDVAPPGTVVEGTGGARRRMNCANASTSLRIDAFAANVLVAVELAEKLVLSSGYPAPARLRQLAGNPVPWTSSPGRGRSCMNSSLLMPISTL